MQNSAGANLAGAADGKLTIAHQALHAARGLQLDFAAAPSPTQPPHWLGILFEALRAAAPVLNYVFWGGLFAAVVMILWLLLRDVDPANHRRRAVPSVIHWRPQAEAARALLQEADALASGGRYAEAIHLLLFRSIEELAAKQPGAVSAALTSREIMRRAPMPEKARAAFTRIAEAVERTFFGGDVAGEAEFLSCRRDYEAFAFTEGWR